MRYNTISLKDIIEKLGKSEAISILSDFSCPINTDVEEFMHYKAYPFECAGMSKTYLITASEKVMAEENGENIEKIISYGVCAIYSVTTKSITIDSNMTRKSRQIAFGTSYALGSPINAILIGQLSKNYTNDNNKYITGEIIMSLIIDHVKEMDVLVPSVSVYVECENKPELINYYERYSFKYFGTNKDGLLQYIIPTKKFISPEYKQRHINNEYAKSKQILEKVM